MAEPFVVVVWARARGAEARILADLQRRFELSRVVELEWPERDFARHLTRLYGEALPSNSHKVDECGTGPFLVVAGVDPAPRYGRRRTTRGVARVNARLARAKRRYRRWTGGGFGVHGSLDVSEASRDLRLLLGESGEQVARRRWDGTIESRRVDPLDWPSVRDLLAAVAAATPAVVVDESADLVELRADDVWWAAVIAGGDPPPEDASEVVLEATIGGRAASVRVTALRPVGAG